VIQYDNTNRGFIRLSTTKITFDWLNIYLSILPPDDGRISRNRYWVGRFAIPKLVNPRFFQTRSNRQLCKAGEANKDNYKKTLATIYFSFPNQSRPFFPSHFFHESERGGCSIERTCDHKKNCLLRTRIHLCILPGSDIIYFKGY
jgi:hypothetical protein